MDSKPLFETCLWLGSIITPFTIVGIVTASASYSRSCRLCLVGGLKERLMFVVATVGFFTLAFEGYLLLLLEEFLS